MNVMLNFYKTIIQYLGNSSNVGFVREQVLRAAGACEELVWVGTADTLNTLHECIHRVNEKYDDTYESILEEFAIVAFKDLSSLRDPSALGVFERLTRVCRIKHLAHFIWPRKIIERKDGSAVIVLHVSSLGTFEEIMNRKAITGTFKEGMMACGIGQPS